MPKVSPFNGEPPLLVSTTRCELLTVLTACGPKFRAVGKAEIPGGGRPVPESATVWVPNAVFTVRPPLSGPTFAGTYTTEMAQVACPIRKEPQLFWAVKSPLTAMEIPVNAMSPLLVSDTCCGVLLVPTCCCEKFRLVPESTAVATACPLPESCTSCVPASSWMESTPVRPPAAVGVKVTAIVHP